MYELKKIEKYLRVNLLGPDPRLMKKEFTGPRSHEGRKTLHDAYHTELRSACMTAIPPRGYTTVQNSFVCLQIHSCSWAPQAKNRID